MYGFPPIKYINNNNNNKNIKSIKREYNIDIKKILANKSISTNSTFIKIDESKDQEIEVINKI